MAMAMGPGSEGAEGIEQANFQDNGAPVSSERTGPLRRLRSFVRYFRRKLIDCRTSSDPEKSSHDDNLLSTCRSFIKLNICEGKFEKAEIYVYI